MTLPWISKLSYDIFFRLLRALNIKKDLVVPESDGITSAVSNRLKGGLNMIQLCLSSVSSLCLVPFAFSIVLLVVFVYAILSKARGWRRWWPLTPHYPVPGLDWRDSYGYINIPKASCAGTSFAFAPARCAEASPTLYSISSKRFPYRAYRILLMGCSSVRRI